LESIRNISIRKKLTALMMVISVLILFLVSGLYIAEEIYSSRVFLQREMTTVGATLGNSCKNLLMVKKLSATRDILASLSVQPNIHAAYLFDDAGTPIAQYLDPAATQFVLKIVPRDFDALDESLWVSLTQPKMSTSWQHFGLFLPIMHGERQVGTIYLMSDLHDLHGRISWVAFVVLALLGMLSFLSWWLAGKLQRPVSGPLLSLVDTMGTISESKDFTLRVHKEGGDEIGQLVDGFNHMLEQIETHRSDLVKHQQSLEQTVDRRTEELRNLVRVLERAKYQAESASEAKSHFLANITHELRTPLIGVLGMNELLFRTTMDEQQQMLANLVQKSGEDLLTLINNVLDFSKIEAGKLQLEEAEFALYRTIDDVLNLLSGRAMEKGITLYSQVPVAATCRVLGDEVRIRQILMNLIGNAIKFTEQGSVSIKVNCRHPQTDLAVFSVEVQDTGIGIDEETQQEIFAAFYQADVSHTRNYGGTGLGLAIVMQLLKLLDGTISLESTVSKGSCFKFEFSLPLVAATDLLLPETMHQQPVLVHAEDEECRQILGSRLEELGMTAVTTRTVADAWCCLKDAERNGEHFQLAIFSADAMLPDGRPLYAALREDLNFSTLRRIMLLKRTESIALKKSEHKIFMPVGWDDLRETLCQSWHEPHLVEKQPGEDLSAAKTEMTSLDHKVLLAGGNVASRELIKISLEGLPVDVETVKDLAQLKSKSGTENIAAILLDLAAMPVAALHEYCRHRQDNPPLFVIHNPSEKADTLKPLVSGVIEKPVTRELLLQHIEPLVGSEITVHDKPADAFGGEP
jgi:signal transduction histidine kinase/CheY-like chemotaxis protein